MADNPVVISANTKEIDDLAKRCAQKSSDFSPATRKIAGIMFEAVEKNFEEEGRPKWPDLKASTKKRREKLGTWPGKILQTGAKGGMAASVSEDHDATSAEVGSNKIYAATHQFGRPPIPARPFLQLTDEDEKDIEDVLKDFLDHL